MFEKLLGDEDGLKVTNYPKVALYIAKRLRKSVGSTPILEVCCGVGGTTIELAQFFPKVYAIDIYSSRIKFAKENILKAGLISKVDFFPEDIFSKELSNKLSSKNISVVHTDVEWTESGIYGQDHATDIRKTNPDTLKLFYFLKENFTENVCMRLPKGINKKQLRDLCKCEIEEIYKNGELKFVYVYFGKLISKPSNKAFFNF